MKKLLSILLLSVLLCSSALAASEFNPSSSREAKQLGLECFKLCAFGAEYNSSTSLLTRWEETVKIYVEGSPSKADMETLDDFMEECSWKCPNMPALERVYDKTKANIVLYYGPLNTLTQHIDNYTEGNWGYFTYWYSDYRRVRGQIVIATDVTNQKQRNHLLKEELVGVLGLSNDHKMYTDSILYAPWTETQQLSEVDWIMLNMLYHRTVACGMSSDNACALLQQHF